MTTIAELVQELEIEAGETRRALEQIPEDRLAWRPHPRSFSLGQLAMHVATLPAALAGVSMQPSFEVGRAIPRPEATAVAELTATLAGSVAEARRLLEGMGDAGLEAPWRLMREGQELFTIPRGMFIRRLMFNHWYHHRGQLTVYLRLAGGHVPGIYGASADEEGQVGGGR